MTHWGKVCYNYLFCIYSIYQNKVTKCFQRNFSFTLPVTFKSNVPNATWNTKNWFKMGNMEPLFFHITVKYLVDIAFHVYTELIYTLTKMFCLEQCLRRRRKLLATMTSSFCNFDSIFVLLQGRAPPTYLGVYIDSKLDWAKNTEIQRAKAVSTEEAGWC